MEEFENQALTDDQPLEEATEAKENPVLKFVRDNKDALLLAGQLALVALICVAGIRNDLEPQDCRCRKCRKKRKKKRKK